MRHLILVDLRRHPARTVLTGLGIAIGVATIVALLALSAGIDRSASGLINLGGAELGMFQGGVGELTASSLPESLVPRVRRQPGVADADPIAVATGELRKEPSFLVFGVEPAGFVLHSLVFIAGRPPRGGREAVIGDGAARQLGLDVGDRLRLSDVRRLAGIGNERVAIPLATVERVSKAGADGYILGPMPGDCVVVVPRDRRILLAPRLLDQLAVRRR